MKGNLNGLNGLHVLNFVLYSKIKCGKSLEVLKLKIQLQSLERSFDSLFKIYVQQLSLMSPNLKRFGKLDWLVDIIT